MTIDLNDAPRQLLKPTVHLNGTARIDLLEAYNDALSAIKTAMLRLAETLPNGRDYYPQGDTVIARAIEQHVDRMDRLRSVVSELNEIAESLYD